MVSQMDDTSTIAFKGFDISEGVERGKTLTEQVYSKLQRGLLMGVFSPISRYPRASFREKCLSA